MSEQVTFHFEGGLADAHRLNFYEAARFQYAASRLIVKLDKFRYTGSFPRKITDLSNRDIELKPHADGSFDIAILIPPLVVAYQTFVDVSISTMMSYVFDRLIGKSSDTDVAKALNTIGTVTENFGKISDNESQKMSQVLTMLSEERDRHDKTKDKLVESLESRLAEMTRERDLAQQESRLRRIDPAREQRLITMAAPLVTEMATALRRSAETLEINTDEGTGGDRRIVYLNKRMANEIELSSVDRDITPIMGNIIQYNKETGWGKLRMSISESPLSFTVPSDIKGKLQSQLLAAMGRDQVYLQIYVVRDKLKAPSRVVVAGILPNPPA